MNPERNYNMPNMERNFGKTNINKSYTTSNVSMNQRMSCKQLLDWVCMLGFCRDDMLLYLDTHPKDKEALAYYKECNDLYLNAEKSYEEAYGPLTIDAAGAENGIWDWGKMPLPWEGVK